jgi:glycosyltransferase involved in cell wall biosynthesis
MTGSQPRISGDDLPTISVVVPSFNQAAYLEACLDSVLDQGYPKLELIVIDGGSTDDSVAIIRRYTDRLSYWVSEPDGGQTNGLIKGFSRATGAIQCWLNSDDMHEPGTLDEVAEFFRAHPDVDAVYGDTTWIDRDGQRLREQREIPFSRFLWFYTHNYIPGMSMFWRREIYDRVGGLDPSFDLAMDADLFIRFADVGRIAHVRRLWSRMRFYPDQKNRRLRDKSTLEDLRIRRRYWGRDWPSAYAVKRGVATFLRALWRLASGCFKPGYRFRMDRVA